MGSNRGEQQSDELLLVQEISGISAFSAFQIAIMSLRLLIGVILIALFSLPSPGLHDLDHLAAKLLTGVFREII